MVSPQFCYGFRILGDCRNERRLVEWEAAFRGYIDCHGAAEVNREAYLSAFTFGDEFRRHLDPHEATGDRAGRRGSGGTSTVKMTSHSPHTTPDASLRPLSITTGLMNPRC